MPSASCIIYNRSCVPPYAWIVSVHIFLLEGYISPKPISLTVILQTVSDWHSRHTCRRVVRFGRGGSPGRDMETFCLSFDCMGLMKNVS